ncbi:MAG: N-acetyltransferase [Desulfobacteraceae bacterium]|nr:MAG: N-acetyltransferase [Desulfobacteraceae bacterium]
MAFRAETERMLLREFREADAEHLFRIYRNPTVMRFMGPPPDRLEEARNKIIRHREQYYRQYGYGLWAMVLKEDNRLIGRSGLLQAEVEGKPVIEIAYLLDQGYWGQGYATEAARAVLTIAEKQFKMERVVAFINPQNFSSIRVAERIGFVYNRETEYKNFGKVSLYVSSFKNA